MGGKRNGGVSKTVFGQLPGERSMPGGQETRGCTLHSHTAGKSLVLTL